MLKSLGKVRFRPRQFEKEICVNPCMDEHWISTDLFKFKLYAEQIERHVIGFCSQNQIPHFSLFCDEVVLLKSNPTWYQGDYTGHGNIMPNGYNLTDIENPDGIRADFSRVISDEAVIKRFSNREISILKSDYELFESLELPNNIIVMEVKDRCYCRSQLQKIFKSHLPVVGLNRDFQTELLKRVSAKSYMAIQILASNYLNWQFICCEGSSNLMGVLPVKTLLLSEQLITHSFANIVHGLHGGNIPYINNPQTHFKWEVDKFIKGNHHHNPNFTKDYVNLDMLEAAYKYRTENWRLPKINFI